MSGQQCMKCHQDIPWTQEKKENSKNDLRTPGISKALGNGNLDKKLLPKHTVWPIGW